PEGLLGAAGGGTGAGLPAGEAARAEDGRPELSDDAQEFIRLEKATTSWPIAADLEKAQRTFADALVAGDETTVARLLVPGLELEATAWPLLRGTAYSHHVTVAFARLGHQRLVKTRLEGPSGSATVLARWTASGEGWRIAALDVARRDAALPAGAASSGTVLVANRGEIARRVFRGCRALGLRTVAVYSEADRGALHVRDADTAVEIGAAAARDSYLNAERILEAARRTGADPIHPGYGFLSESWRLPEAVPPAGIPFMAPNPAAHRQDGH